MSERCEESCPCTQLTHDPKLVVLTGGPGAGKTAVLELVKKGLCQHIQVLPEAATIIFSGGFLRRPGLEALKAAQKAIYHVQKEQENMILNERSSAVILCDRGVLDGLAYWPEKEEHFWREVGSNRNSDVMRYSAVIHLRTPSQALGYNHQNPVRTETAQQALEIDRKIAEVWKDHPNRTFVDSSTDFLSKAKQAIDLVRRELPECCLSAPKQGS